MKPLAIRLPSMHRAGEWDAQEFLNYKTLQRDVDCADPTMRREAILQNETFSGLNIAGIFKSKMIATGGGFA